MKYKYVNSLCLFVIILTFCCCGKKKGGENGGSSLNRSKDIIVLLDLSDRLLNNNQIAIDTAIINHVYSCFNDVCRSNYYVKSNDRLMVEVAPQKSFSSNMFDLTDKLRVEMNQVNLQEKSKYVMNYKEEFSKQLSLLYSSVSKSENKSDYAGSDIWKFFNNKLSDITIKDKNRETYLIVLTDGYFDFENIADKKNIGNFYSYSENILSYGRSQSANWKKALDNANMGLIPINVNNTNLHILVLEITPKKHINFYDEENLLKYNWNCWVAQMNIGKFKICEQQQLSITKKVIKDFIENRIGGNAECNAKYDLNKLPKAEKHEVPISNEAKPKKKKRKSLNEDNMPQSQETVNDTI